MFNFFSSLLQRAVAGITAHDSPLAAIEFNTAGTKLATASATVRGIEHVVCYIYLYCVQGTVIRVFSIPQGEKLVEFRRGMKRSEWISKLYHVQAVIHVLL